MKRERERMYDVCLLVTFRTKMQIDIIEYERINRGNVNSYQISKFHRIFPFFLSSFVLPLFIKINLLTLVNFLVFGVSSH